MSHTSSKPRRHHPSSLNPWEALFSSVTRPRKEEVVVATTTANEVSSCRSDYTGTNAENELAAAAAAATGGYTILIQHSMTSSSQRQWAVVASTILLGGNNQKYVNDALAMDNTKSSSLTKTTKISTSIGSGRQSRTAEVAAPWNDSISGPMVVRQAFEELCHRCNGAVVFVSLLGTKGGNLLDLEELGESAGQINNGDGGDGDDDEEDTEDGDNIYQSMNNLQFSSSRSSSQRKRSTSLLRTFRKNGAWVDLSSNPFGWDGDNTDTDNAYNSSINDEDTASCSNSLFVHQSTIHKLQSIVGTIRKAVASIDIRRRHHCYHQNTPNTTTTLIQQQQPIPIVFDSLTPLLHFHSVEKIIVMLKCLKRGAAFSSPPSISIKAGPPSSTTTPPPPAAAAASYPPILSPIVAPVLYESLRPSEHRCLEDAADAMIHLKLLDISEYLASTATKTTTTTAPLADQYTTTAVIPGMIDLVRRGGGGGGGSGGKLIRHCVPVRIMRSSSVDTTNIKQPLKVHWNWEILDHHESHETDVAVAKEEIILQQVVTKKLSSNADQHASTTTSRPQIYLQDDDPDNIFYDEEADYDYG